MLLLTNSLSEEKTDNEDFEMGRCHSLEEGPSNAYSIPDQEGANTDQQK